MESEPSLATFRPLDLPELFSSTAIQSTKVGPELPQAQPLTKTEVSEETKRLDAPINTEEQRRLVSVVSHLQDISLNGLKPGETTETAILGALAAFEFHERRQVVAPVLTTQILGRRDNGVKVFNGDKPSKISVEPHPKFQNVYTSMGNYLRPDEPTCSFCMEDIEVQQPTVFHGTCGQCVHSECMEPWLSKFHRCPFDREPLKEKPTPVMTSIPKNPPPAPPRSRPIVRFPSAPSPAQVRRDTGITTSRATGPTQASRRRQSSSNRASSPLVSHQQAAAVTAYQQGPTRQTAPQIPLVQGPLTRPTQQQRDERRAMVSAWLGAQDQTMTR